MEMIFEIKLILCKTEVLKMIYLIPVFFVVVSERCIFVLIRLIRLFLYMD